MNVPHSLADTMVVIVMNDFDQLVTNFFKNYQDRGMKKWAGFYLSDHTQTLEKDTKKRAEKIIKRPEQTPEEISAVLLQSFSNQLRINIQTSIINPDGELVEEVEGFVNGYDETRIIVGNKRVNLADLLNAKIVTTE